MFKCPLGDCISKKKQKNNNICMLVLSLQLFLDGLQYTLMILAP